MTDLRGQIRAATARLAAAGVPSPQHDAEALAAFVLEVDRPALLTYPTPDDTFAGTFASLVNRRAEREPLQHLIGRAFFRQLTLHVGQGVFIPRPETELTAGAAIDEAQARVSRGAVPVVVDLFAGSGAIAISVATEVRPCVVHAVEAQDEAVNWLRRNVAGRSVIVHRDDVAKVVDRSMSSLQGHVDIVVANPPYVPAGARIVDPEVARHDPPAALWSGVDGLADMRTLEQVASRLLMEGGLVVAEHADAQGDSAPQIFRQTGAWIDVVDHLDLNDRPRYLTARRQAPS
jgi:release factor glutamine methyltransferase